MNELILEAGNLVSQAEAVIPADPQLSNSDLPTGQQYYCLSQAEERQADEWIAAWEQYNAPWTLSFFLECLRGEPQTLPAFDYSFTSSSIESDGHYGQQSDREREPQTLPAFDYSFTSSSIEPDGHYGQPPARESHLMAALTDQMPVLNANQRKVPISTPTEPAKHHARHQAKHHARHHAKHQAKHNAKHQAANSHPAHIETWATYALPTGEVIPEQQKQRRIHFAGFPPITQPLPEDVQDEDIIRHWPNHLWGPLLLGIAEKWKLSEISHMTPVDLGSNAISKRIKAARIQVGEVIPQCECRKRKRLTREGRTLDEHQVVPQPGIESSISYNPHSASPLGYSRSKWVAEAICEKAYVRTPLEDSQTFRMNNNREMGSEDLRQSLRMNNNGEMGSEDLGQSDQLPKRRRSDG